MEITVRFTGPLGRLAETTHVQLSLPEGASLHTALTSLAQHVPVACAEQLLRPLLQGSDTGVVLLLNRRRVSGSEELQRPIRDNDIIAFATPMEGG